MAWLQLRAHQFRSQFHLRAKSIDNVTIVENQTNDVSNITNKRIYLNLLKIQTLWKLFNVYRWMMSFHWTNAKFEKIKKRRETFGKCNCVLSRKKYRQKNWQQKNGSNKKKLTSPPTTKWHCSQKNGINDGEKKLTSWGKMTKTGRRIWQQLLQTYSLENEESKTSTVCSALQSQLNRVVKFQEITAVAFEAFNWSCTIVKQQNWIVIFFCTKYSMFVSYFCCCAEPVPKFLVDKVYFTFFPFVKWPMVPKLSMKLQWKPSCNWKDHFRSTLTSAQHNSAHHKLHSI